MSCILTDYYISVNANKPSPKLMLEPYHVERGGGGGWVVIVNRILQTADRIHHTSEF